MWGASGGDCTFIAHIDGLEFRGLDDREGHPYTKDTTTLAKKRIDEEYVLLEQDALLARVIEAQKRIVGERAV